MAKLSASIQHIMSQPKVMKFGPWVTMMFFIIMLITIAAFGTTRYLADNFQSIVNCDYVDSESYGVALLANIWSMNLGAQTMSISWSIICACGAAYTGQGNDSCVENGLSIPMDLYFNLVSANVWNTSTPAGRYDPNTIRVPPSTYYIPGRQTVPTIQFGTVMSMDPFLPYTLDKKASTIYYPFDVFSTYISIVAINPTDNSTIPLVLVRAFGTAVNWVGSGNFFVVTPPGGSPLYSIAIQQERQRAVKVFSLLIVAINWMLSITILWMTVIVLFRQKIDSSLLLASITVLFALPQIRASMPDAPPFGSFIDIWGYFMSVALVGVCTSVLLLTQLRYRYQPPQTSGRLENNTPDTYQLLPWRLPTLTPTASWRVEIDTPDTYQLRPWRTSSSSRSAHIYSNQ